MPEPLPVADFRSRRYVLLQSDFAYAPRPAPPASDLVDAGTWLSVTQLPDDVAIRTSDYHGSTIGHMHDLWGAWIEAYGPQDSVLGTMLDAADDFQAATFNALCGYYRLSVAALRSAVELMTIGTWAQVCGKEVELAEWRTGGTELKFGQCCDALHNCPRLAALNDVVAAQVRTPLFAPKLGSVDEGGYARVLFGALSNFAHSRPGCSDGDLRQSNGPIYVRGVFRHVAWIYFEVVAFCFVLLQIARPGTILPGVAKELIADMDRIRSRATRTAHYFLNSKP